MPTLPLLAGDLRFFASSPALPFWYINLPLYKSTINIEYLVKNKTNLVWDLAHFWLKTWIFHIRSTISGAFLHVFSHWQRLFPASKQWFRILTVCKSCKTSYNVLSHSHWGLRAGSIFRGGGGGGTRWNSGGVVKKRHSPDFRSPEVGISAFKPLGSCKLENYHGLRNIYLYFKD